MMCVHHRTFLSNAKNKPKTSTQQGSDLKALSKKGIHMEGEVQTHYKLIHDPAQVLNFARLLFSDVEEPDHVRLVMLLARRKYMTTEERALVRGGGKNENLHLPRRIIRHSSQRREKRFLNEIRSYEVPIGTYTFADDEETIPPSCLALYVTLQSRSAIDAGINLQSELSQALRKAISDPHAHAGEAKAKFARLDSIFKGELHRSKSCGREYIDLDVDTNDATNLKHLHDFLCEQRMSDLFVFMIKTRGGYHVVYDKLEIKERLASLYQFARTTIGPDKKQWLSIISDGMVPIPGTIQGGFNVNFVDGLRLN